MDFKKFDSKAAAAVGAWLHLKNPATGELLWHDDDQMTMPCRVKVQGSESPKAQEVLKTIAKARAKDKDADTSKTMSDLHKDLVAIAKPLIQEFENVHNGVEPATAEDADWFLNLQVTNGQAEEQSFAEQIVSFAFKRASFLGNVPKS
jgi:hypothetical protein